MPCVQERIDQRRDANRCRRSRSVQMTSMMARDWPDTLPNRFSEHGKVNLLPAPDLATSDGINLAMHSLEGCHQTVTWDHSSWVDDDLTE